MTMDKKQIELARQVSNFFDGQELCNIVSVLEHLVAFALTTATENKKESLQLLEIFIANVAQEISEMDQMAKYMERESDNVH